MNLAEEHYEEERITLFARLHEEIKAAIMTKDDILAMRLLEQCQEEAVNLGNEMEKEQGKDCEIIPVLDDYCELVYEINEQIWHKEHVNPGKVHKYLNKSLELIKRSMSRFANDVSI